MKRLECSVEIHNERLDRWELESLGDLVDVVLLTHTLKVSFKSYLQFYPSSLES